MSGDALAMVGARALRLHLDSLRGIRAAARHTMVVAQNGFAA